ncbi:MAG: M23 family peptidase [Acidimicrobiia bacterium]|nr:M23 family peptidase [Acidimicrobiia bacterium]
MKQDYFIVVLAHSFHGRLRRLHIPHKALYILLALAVIGGFSVMGMVSSYARMAWKVSNYNSLQQQFETLRERYARLQKSAHQTNEQLATLQVFATEVSLAYGVKRQLEGPPDISGEAPLLPSYRDTLEQYNFLKSASISRGFRKYPRLWQANVRPSLWPIHGRLMSSFGLRTDPFSGEGAFHPGVDLSAEVGTPIKATADGVVVHAEYAGNYGRLIIVDHGGIQTYYAHLSRIDVIAGQEVRRAQAIGASGASGRVTAPHLHYEVRQGGNPINPYIFLARSAGGEAPAGKDLPF